MRHHRLAMHLLAGAVFLGLQGVLVDVAGLTGRIIPVEAGWQNLPFRDGFAARNSAAGWGARTDTAAGNRASRGP